MVHPIEVISLPGGLELPFLAAALAANAITAWSRLREQAFHSRPDRIFLPGKQGGPGPPRFAGSEVAEHFVVSGAAATGGLGRIGTGCAVALGTGKGPQRAVAEGGPVVLGGTALCQNGSTLPVPSQVQNDWANAGLDTAVSTATMV